MRVAFIDTETTGLLRKGQVPPGIVEIGGIIISATYDELYGVPEITEVARFHQRVNPEMLIDEGAAKVHGITQEMVKHEGTFFELFQDFADFMVGATHWGGYNTEFDKQVVEGQLYRYGFERRFPWPPGDIDVMKLASEQMQVQGKQGTKFVKLGDAYKHYTGKELEGAHGALEDILGTIEVWKCL